METGHTEEQLRGVLSAVEGAKAKAHVIPGAQNTAVAVTGNVGPLDVRLFEDLPGVREAIPVSSAYRLAGREARRADTVISLAGGKVRIGGSALVVIAGPCAVESEEQTLRIAKQVARAGARILRGGAFKPRTSPYSFQGLGLAGLKILASARQATGLPVVTEILDPRSLDIVCEYADILQIGARNMQNFALLKEVGRVRKPVMLKRGFSATIEEWLAAAEYILAEGNPDVMLCERGIRTFVGSARARTTLDLNAVPVVKRRSHLPILVDPSHGTGMRDKVAPMARAAVAAGAHGIMVEVHDRPEEALSDGPQALSPEAFARLMGELRAMGPILGFTV